MKKRISTFWMLIVSGIFLVGMVAFSLLYIRFSNSRKNIASNEKYSSYYAMICDDNESSFVRAVYESAADKGREDGIFVELMGENLSRKYSKEDYMEIAIASGVNGIIVEADDSPKMTELINEAMSKDIPVVTLFSDSPASNRCSFVGISFYNLGCEYGEQINKLIDEKDFTYDKIKVTVLVSSSEADNAQNLVYTALKETVDKNAPYRKTSKPVEIRVVSVDTTNSFSVEESLRNLFITARDEVSDIIVCLEEQETESCYQAVVDYNKVGEVTILGYFDSQTILKAIERNVIHSTMSVNTRQMGYACVDAISEYKKLGYTSQYVATDLTLINQVNVNRYIED